ncbi:MAG: hypothetical protein GTN74_10440, partial [Proteobacteria bacterium]|nr:hypothetical protein [Pseudomonadota bacterium]
MKRVLLYGLIILTRIFSDVPLFWMFYFLHFQKQGSGRTSDVLFNGILLISFGVIHSLLARNFVKRYMASWVGEDFVRILQVLIAGATLALVLHLWRPLSGALWRTEGLLYWVLTIFYLACIGGMIYTTFFIDYL